MASFKCADLGMDCHFEASALTRGGLMKKIQTHAASAHNMTSIDAEMQKKIESVIK